MATPEVIGEYKHIGHVVSSAATYCYMLRLNGDIHVLQVLDIKDLAEEYQL